MPSLDVLGVLELDFPTSYQWALSLFGGPSRGVELTSQMSTREKVLWHRAQSFGSGHTWSGEGGRGHPPNQPDQPNQPRQMPPRSPSHPKTVTHPPAIYNSRLFNPSFHGCIVLKRSTLSIAAMRLTSWSYPEVMRGVHQGHLLSVKKSLSGP